MKRTIEINDDLEERIDDALQKVLALARGYMAENGITEKPELSDLDHDRQIHKIIDSHTPIYNHQIKSLWFLYDLDFIDDYNDSGIGYNPRENGGRTAIYCCIDRDVRDRYAKLDVDDLKE